MTRYLVSHKDADDELVLVLEVKDGPHKCDHARGGVHVKCRGDVASVIGSAYTIKTTHRSGVRNQVDCWMRWHHQSQCLPSFGSRCEQPARALTQRTHGHHGDTVERTIGLHYCERGEVTVVRVGGVEPRRQDRAASPVLLDVYENGRDDGRFVDVWRHTQQQLERQRG